MTGVETSEGRHNDAEFVSTGPRRGLTEEERALLAQVTRDREKARS